MLDYFEYVWICISICDLQNGKLKLLCFKSPRLKFSQREFSLHSRKDLLFNCNDAKRWSSCWTESDVLWKAECENHKKVIFDLVKTSTFLLVLSSLAGGFIHCELKIEQRSKMHVRSFRWFECSERQKCSNVRFIFNFSLPMNWWRYRTFSLISFNGNLWILDGSFWATCTNY